MIYQNQFYSFSAERKGEVDGKAFHRVYVLQILPGSPWDELDEVLSELKDTFIAMKADAVKADEEKKKLDAQTVYVDKPIEVTPEVTEG